LLKKEEACLEEAESDSDEKLLELSIPGLKYKAKFQVSSEPSTL